jgi:UDP-GlcNAc:undecaprenyl-phosphate GlcNAc-1-phosphate transferase
VRTGKDGANDSPVVRVDGATGAISIMGDSGAQLLGFSFAAVTLSSGRQTPGRSDVLSIVAAPVLVLLIPIFDTTLVTLSRWFSGRRASQGGRDHSSHRLVAIGLSERRAVALLWMLAAVGGGLGVALDRFHTSYSTIAAAFAFVVGMVIFAAYLAGIRVYDDTDVRVRQGSLTPIVVDFMYKRRVGEVLLDFCLVTLCYYVAYRLRFEDPEEFMKNFQMFTSSLPIIVTAQLGAFFVVGVYRGVWRHFGMMDTLTIARGVFFGTFAAVLAILFIPYFQTYSRTAFGIYAVLIVMATTLSRASFRIVGAYMQRQRQVGRRIAIYGAGDAAGLVLRELLAHDAENVRIVGFIDDDPRKAGIRVMGYLRSLGNVAANLDGLSYDETFARSGDSPVRTADPQAEEKMIALIEECKKEGNTLGGVFEVVALGLPPGLGTHTQWDRKLDGRLAQAVMAVQECFSHSDAGQSINSTTKLRRD